MEYEANDVSASCRIDGVPLQAATNVTATIEINNGTILLDHKVRFTSEPNENSVVLISLQYTSGKLHHLLKNNCNTFWSVK